MSNSRISQILANLNTLVVYEPSANQPRTRLRQRVALADEKTVDLVLGECACEPAPSSPYTLNRLAGPRRSQIEVLFLQRVNHFFSGDKARILNYLSMGSGQLLQDFILCARMLLAGYSIAIILIEPNHLTAEFQEALAGFKILEKLARENGVSCSILHFASIRDYNWEFPDEEIHIAQAIDYVDPREECALDDLNLVHQKLAKNGFFYFASQAIDIVFSKLMETYIHFHMTLEEEQTNMLHYIVANLAQFDGRIAKVETLLHQTTNIPENRLIKNILAYSGGLFQWSLVAEEKLPAASSTIIEPSAAATLLTPTS